MTRRSRRSRTMSRFRRSVGTAGVLALAVALAPSAHAEVILHEKFAGSSSGDFELCGIGAHRIRVQRRYQLRVGKGDLDSAFFLSSGSGPRDDHESRQRRLPRDRGQQSATTKATSVGGRCSGSPR